MFNLLSLVLLLKNNREICAQKTCVNDFCFTCTVRALVFFVCGRGFQNCDVLLLLLLFY